MGHVFTARIEVVVHFNRSALLASVIGIALISAGGVGAWKYSTTRARTKLQQARESISRDLNESLPMGSTVQEVEEFMTKHRMVHAPMERSTTYEDAHDGAATFIEARTLDRIDALLFSCTIFVRFEFDANSRLKRYSQQPACSNPW